MRTVAHRGGDGDIIRRQLYMGEVANHLYSGWDIDAPFVSYAITKYHESGDTSPGRRHRGYFARLDWSVGGDAAYEGYCVANQGIFRKLALSPAFRLNLPAFACF